MAIARRPETFIALRARHEALRIAEAVIRGAGVDVEQLNCHTCGGDLNWRDAIEQVAIDCPACGAVNELPCHLRYRVAPQEQEGCLDYASIEPDRRVWWNDTIPDAAQVYRSIPAPTSPLWLKIFCLACLAVVLMSLAMMAIATQM